MAEQHRATADEWASVKALASGGVAYSTILELLHRVEALEAPIDLSHLSNDKREKILKLLANPGRFEVLEVAQPAQPNYPEKPDSSLVEGVAAVIDNGTACDRRPDRIARDAIRAVTAWMREQKVYGVGWIWAVERLEEEAER
jgi:hypothetical protein